MYLEQAGSWHSSEFLGLHLAIADTIYKEVRFSSCETKTEEADRGDERGRLT